MTNNYEEILDKIEQEKKDSDLYTRMRKAGVGLNDEDLMRTLREIGPDGRETDVNFDWDFVQRARLASDQGFCECTHMGWANEEHYGLTNKGRAHLGLPLITPAPSLWQRLKSLVVAAD
ncbi:hypothetical protein [Bradyrhizobium sp. URHD0069]|uniref:hypothetical protein n=1 Tax=Bradyrhizobium sp. URHD0069 TaxID=1380355 RepID=UPI000495BC6E|nr:hypothetical protein [Bradyrhizobium sp. URHD0069]